MTSLEFPITNVIQKLLQQTFSSIINYGETCPVKKRSRSSYSQYQGKLQKVDINSNVAENVPVTFCYSKCQKNCSLFTLTETITTTFRIVVKCR